MMRVGNATATITRIQQHAWFDFVLRAFSREVHANDKSRKLRIPHILS
jgi:hypothetical protein